MAMSCNITLYHYGNDTHHLCKQQTPQLLLGVLWNYLMYSHGFAHFTTERKKEICFACVDLIVVMSHDRVTRFDRAFRTVNICHFFADCDRNNSCLACVFLFFSPSLPHQHHGRVVSCTH